MCVCVCVRACVRARVCVCVAKICRFLRLRMEGNAYDIVIN